jgi:uncharacterized phage protein gp47/JayE
MAITRIELPSLNALSDRFCRDVRLGRIRAGVTNPNVAPGSEIAIRGDAYASPVLEIMARNVALQDATMPDSALGDDLIRLARVWRGMEPSLGAGAQGNVRVTTSGVVTYAKDSECRAADGLRYKVVTSTTTNNGGLVPVIGVDVGKRTERVEGVELTWTSPPAGSDTKCKVGPGGLTNGADPDNNARLRRRFQDSLRHPAQSGSWAHYVEWAEANAAVQKAFCYPARRGPSTVDVVIAVEPTAETYYSREASVALVNSVALAVVAADPEHADVLTQSVTDEDVNVYLRATIPLPVEDGGSGGGWIDGTALHWPKYVATTPAHLEAAPTNAMTIQVDTVAGGNTPLVGSRIAIWSRSRRKFVHTRIATVALSAGFVYNLTLLDPIDTSILQSGDYISPDADKLDDYASTLIEQFATLGPGEETSSALLLPRSYRRPLVTESWPSALTSVQIGALSTAHTEITHVATIAPSLPAIPTVATAPNILTLGKLAIHKL